MTLLLLFFHGLLYFGALVISRYPIVTVFHLVLAVSAFSFVIRPLLSLATGGYVLYPISSSSMQVYYNQGLIYQLIFMTFYVLGYLIGYLKNRRARQSVAPAVENNVSRGFFLSLALGISVVSAIHFLSGGNWLPTARETTLTAVTPFGKVLFPLATISLSVALPLAYLAYKRRPSRWGIMVTGFFISAFLLTLLYQRGFLISGVVLVAFFWERFAKIRYRHIFVLGVALLALLGQVRPLAHIISSVFVQGGEAVEGQNYAVPSSLLDRILTLFLYSPNFDTIDVWPIVISYSEENDFVYGLTFLNAPARVLPPGKRHELGILTAVDMLNEYYWGDLYWETNFGFNVSLAQELYLNWGILGLLFSFIPGFFTAKLDTLIRRFRTLSTRTVYVAGAVFAGGGFVGELAGVLLWAITYMLIGLVLDFVSRLVVVARGARQHSSA